MTDAEWEVLKPHTQRLNVRTVTRSEKGWTALAAHPCPFYDRQAKACQVYDDRPYNCRRFQCGRWNVQAEPFTSNPLPIIRSNNDLRWTYDKNQRDHMPWALAHGWNV
jgi:Fe-S-cluster containining protein